MTIQPFGSLDEATEAALRASISRFGVVVPIVIDGRGQIVDGHHRSRIAMELGVSCPQIKRAVRNEDDATALAYSLNADRRHLTAGERREIVASLREQGHSLRAIAGATGVSKSQVAKDVEVSTGGHLTQPAKVKGADGKSYPAKKAKRPKAPPKIEPEEAATSDGAEARESEVRSAPPAETSPDSLTPKLRLAALFARQAEVREWIAFDGHEAVILSMSSSQRADYGRFLIAVSNHVGTSQGYLDKSHLKAVKS